MRRLAAGVLALLLGAFVLAAVVLRLIGDDPAVWHADPLTAARTGTPNDYLLAPVGVTAAAPDRKAAVHPLSPEQLMARLDAAALAEPRTRRIAGDGARATYVQRSRLFGFPDYISVRAVEVPGGSALVVWSRSRFGYDDMGANRARVDRWVAALAD